MVRGVNPYPLGYGRCPVCGDWVSILKSGVLRVHSDKRMDSWLPFHPKCKGAGGLPSAKERS